MAKVPKVLGDLAPKFSGTSFYVNGAGNNVPRAIYIFPKREACLMAMPYSSMLLKRKMLQSLIYWTPSHPTTYCGRQVMHE